MQQQQSLDPIVAAQNTLAILDTASVPIGKRHIVNQCVTLLEAIINKQVTVIETPPPEAPPAEPDKSQKTDDKSNKKHQKSNSKDKGAEHLASV